jgi:CHAD domain-containing protein
MTSEGFTLCCERRRREILKRLGPATEYGVSEDIHALRVEIKRWRALVNAVGWISPEFDPARLIGPFEDLFRAMGKIRNLHVQMGRVRMMMAGSRLELSEYYNFLKREEGKQKAMVARAGEAFDRDALEAALRMMRAALADIPVRQIRSRLGERFKTLIEELESLKSKGRLSDRDYHRLRMGSKEARYTLEIWRECFPGREVPARMDDALRTVHQTLGRWHDDDVAARDFQVFLEKAAEKPLFSPVSARRYLTALEEEKAKLLGEFESQWADCVRLARRLRQKSA